MHGVRWKVSGVRCQGQVPGDRGGGRGWQAGPAVPRLHRAPLEEALWQKQVQHEAQRPEDLHLLGRRTRGGSSTAPPPPPYPPLILTNFVDCKSFVARHIQVSHLFKKRTTLAESIWLLSTSRPLTIWGFVPKIVTSRNKNYSGRELPPAI